jgi:hypothetical protein
MSAAPSATCAGYACGTPYKVYYHHEPGDEVLSVVAVWSGMRGVGPSMGK